MYRRHAAFAASRHTNSLSVALPSNPRRGVPRTPLPQRKNEEVIDISKRKDKMVAMRFSQSEHAAIKHKADKAGMSFTEFVTTAALGKPIVVIEGLDAVLREQRAIGRNLNQITTLCNMGKIWVPDLAEVKMGFAFITDKLSELLQRYV